jgi:hypothetical protein
MRRLLIFITLLACLVAGSFAESGWKEYVNARFGFKFSHPSTLVAGRLPTNGGGLIFTSRDKEFEISASGQFMVGDDTLDKRWADELKDLESFVTYKRKAADWYVISGVKDGIEFYHKAFSKNGNGVFLDIDYPHAKAAQYDPWVERITKSFVPFLKGDYDRIEK